MKNLTIQKKMPVVTLFIGIGIVSLLVIFASCSTNKKLMKDINLMSIHENNSTVSAFVSYVDAYNSKVPDHSYINIALLKLADATNAMAGVIGYKVMGDINMAKVDANEIIKNANEATHADNIRKSANILSSVLQNMQVKYYPTLTTSGSELVIASAAIDPSILTHHQKEEIMAFFKKSAYLLEKMN